VTLYLSPKDVFAFNADGELTGSVLDNELWERPSFEKTVTRIGQKLLQDNRIKEQIAFHVLPGKALINADANDAHNMVRISRGLLAYIENDDELAAVLSHEIAHIILRHRVQYPKETPDILLQRVLRLEPEPFEDSVNDDKEQQKELDADRFGLRMIVKSGYQPDAMVSILKKVATDGSDLWRTHPMGSHRISVLRQQISRLKRSGLYHQPSGIIR
jgi:predicted Zn-dependent protease